MGNVIYVSLHSIQHMYNLFLNITHSSVVWREGMGTALPHKKLSGNSVPTREILRDIFSLLLLNYIAIVNCYHVTAFHARQTMCQNWHQNLKSISNGVCSIYIVDGLYHKIHEFPLKKTVHLSFGVSKPLNVRIGLLKCLFLIAWQSCCSTYFHPITDEKYLLFSLNLKLPFSKKKLS